MRPILLVLLLLLASPALAQTPTQDAVAAFDALRNGDWSLAQFLATRAIEAGTLPRGDLGAAHAYRGDARRHLDNLEGALADYNKALEMGLPAQFAARVVNNRGITNMELRDMPRAVADFTAAIRADPTFAEAHDNRCTLYLLLGALDLALADCSQAIKLYPDNPRAYVNRGQVYMELEFFEEAVDDFTTAIELAPSPEDAVVAAFNRGLAWEALGEADLAFDDFAFAFEIDPNRRDYQEKFQDYGLLPR